MFLKKNEFKFVLYIFLPFPSKTSKLSKAFPVPKATQDTVSCVALGTGKALDNLDVLENKLRR